MPRKRRNNYCGNEEVDRQLQQFIESGISHGPELGGPGGRRLPTRQLEVQEPDLTQPSPGNDSDDILKLPQGRNGRKCQIN
jgi:hypothetical protein